MKLHCTAMGWRGFLPASQMIYWLAQMAAEASTRSGGQLSSHSTACSHPQPRCQWLPSNWNCIPTKGNAGQAWESFLIPSVHFFPPNQCLVGAASTLGNCIENIITQGIRHPEQVLFLSRASASQQRNPSAGFCFNYIFKTQLLVCVPLY